MTTPRQQYPIFWQGVNPKHQLLQNLGLTRGLRGYRKSPSVYPLDGEDSFGWYYCILISSGLSSPRKDHCPSPLDFLHDGKKSPFKQYFIGSPTRRQDDPLFSLVISYRVRSLFLGRRLTLLATLTMLSLHQHSIRWSYSALNISCTAKIKWLRRVIKIMGPASSQNWMRSSKSCIWSHSLHI